MRSRWVIWHSIYAVFGTFMPIVSGVIAHRIALCYHSCREMLPRRHTVSVQCLYAGTAASKIKQRGYGLMRKRNWAAMMMVLLLGVCLLCGCSGSKTEKIQALEGTWVASDPVSTDTVREMLLAMDFYEEEIQLVDLNSLYDSYYVEFTSGRTYALGHNPLKFKYNVYTFFCQVFQDLYENRTALNSIYGVSFDGMDETEFQRFYADLYEKGSFSEMIMDFTEGAFQYDQLGVYDSGMFDVSGNIIDFKTSSAGEVGQCTYELRGNTLTIYFKDSTSVFTKEY